MMYNGYGTRGNDILGFANKPNMSLYETLVYATGPGYWYHLQNDTNAKEVFTPMKNYSADKRKEALYMHQSLIPLTDAAHGGEDVPCFSDGPGSFLLQRVFEQSYIAYAISYASCIGPISHLNPSCTKQQVQQHFRNNAAQLIENNNRLLILILVSFITLVKKVLY